MASISGDGYLAETIIARVCTITGPATAVAGSASRGCQVLLYPCELASVCLLAGRLAEVSVLKACEEMVLCMGYWRMSDLPQSSLC
jgi:hypothetical protein